MAMKYQTVHINVDPGEEGHLNLKLRNVLLTPSGFILEARFWPQIKACQFPLKLEIFPGKRMKVPVECEGRAYEEHGREGITYGIQTIYQKSAYNLMARTWKVSSKRKERRKYPRIPLFPEGVTPITGTLNVLHHAIPFELSDYTINGLGLRVSDEEMKKIDLDQKVTLELKQKLQKRLKLLPKGVDERAFWDELKMEGEIKRKVIFYYSKKESKKWCRVGIRLDNWDPDVVDCWRHWIKMVVLTIRNKQKKS